MLGRQGRACGSHHTAEKGQDPTPPAVVGARTESKAGAGFPASWPALSDPCQKRKTDVVSQHYSAWTTGRCAMMRATRFLCQRFSVPPPVMTSLTPPESKIDCSKVYVKRSSFATADHEFDGAFAAVPIKKGKEGRRPGGAQPKSGSCKKFVCSFDTVVLTSPLFFAIRRRISGERCDASPTGRIRWEYLPLHLYLVKRETQQGLGHGIRMFSFLQHGTSKVDSTVVLNFYSAHFSQWFCRVSSLRTLG
jgi:hypothetical protein